MGRTEKIMPEQQPFYAPPSEAMGGRILTGVEWFRRRAASAPSDGSRDESDDTSDASLEDAARSEQEYLRERLRRELKREPSEEEMNEWLREHTEGY